MYEHSYKSGSWWIICDRCSKKIRGEEAKHEWTGFIVCSDCFEHRHPQDFIRARKEVITPPFTRPRPQDEFVGVCTLVGQMALPKLAVAGCVVAGRVPSDFGYITATLLMDFICSPETKLANADIGTADCMTINNIEGFL